MQYFAQDEATRMDPAPTVYETLASGSPLHMVPAIRNILGGFLFSGDDVYKHVRVLSGGERTRLAVARMLLRPSNTLLLDEPTNHLDLDSKEVLLDALVDYGGTLIFVSHDRYFVERLATKIIEVGNGTAVVYPGHLQGVPVAQGARRRRAAGQAGRASQAGRAGRRTQAGSAGQAGRTGRRRQAAAGRKPARAARARPAAAADSARDAKKRGGRRGAEAAARRHRRGRRDIDALETRIAETEKRDQGARAAMAAPGFLRRPRRRPAGHRPSSGADVAGRRPDAPVGGAAGSRRPTRP